MNYYPSMYPQSQFNQMPQQSMIQSSSSLISVRNEDEARMYPIAPGNSITFKDENTPYIYTKTMGFSQLDRPIFEKYRLIKEDQPAAQINSSVESKYASKDELADVINKISDLQNELLAIKSQSGDKTQGGE